MSNILKEYEARVMLTEQEYLDIVSHYMKLYPNHHFLQNNNYYLDTKDLSLRKRHITFRIRTINNAKAKLTLKIKGNNGDEEINDDITFKEMDTILKSKVFPNGNVKSILLTFSTPLSSYENILVLYNRRLEIDFDNHLLVIDKNEYNDIIDYNLEVESKDDISLARKILNDYIKNFNLSLGNEKYIGKATRAIDSIIKKS